MEASVFERDGKVVRALELGRLVQHQLGVGELKPVELYVAFPDFPHGWGYLLNQNLKIGAEPKIELDLHRLGEFATQVADFRLVY